MALSKGLEWLGNYLSRKKDCFPSKWVSFLYQKKISTHLRHVCVQINKYFSVQVKNKPDVGIRNMHFILGTPVLMVATIPSYIVGTIYLGVVVCGTQ